MRSLLFRPTRIDFLVFFRIVFGALAFADVMGLWTYYHLYRGDFQTDSFRFTYYWWSWVEPLPEPFMSMAFLFILAAAIGIVLGYQYRLACSIFAIGFTYVFLLEKANYLNHGYLFCWISFIMIFLPADRAFSLRVKRDPSSRMSHIPFWTMAIFPLMMGIVYFYGGIAKINMDWLRGFPMIYWIGQQEDMPILGPLWGMESTAILMSWGGMLLDLTAPFFLLMRRTRLGILFFILMFHLTNTLIFAIGIFPWLSIALSLMFFPPQRPREWVEWLAARSQIVHRWMTNWDERVLPYPAVAANSIWQGAPKNQPYLAAVLVLIIGFHMIYPLRHNLYPGPTAWTEEGHRFSWRMMLRGKRGSGYFNVDNIDTGERTVVRPTDYLSARQQRKLYTHPDMILEFVHFLEEEWEKKGAENVAIFAEIRAGLNGRKFQQYIDPNIDLTDVEWSWRDHSEWIIPFENTEPVPRKKRKNPRQKDEDDD